MLQDSDWRENNDWIHRHPDGQLMLPVKAIKQCSTRNIRPQTDASGFSIKNYFDREILPNLSKMQAVKPDAMLLKTVFDFSADQ